MSKTKKINTFLFFQCPSLGKDCHCRNVSSCQAFYTTEKEHHLHLLNSNALRTRITFGKLISVSPWRHELHPHHHRDQHRLFYCMHCHSLFDEYVFEWDKPTSISGRGCVFCYQLSEPVLVLTPTTAETQNTDSGSGKRKVGETVSDNFSGGEKRMKPRTIKP